MHRLTTTTQEPTVEVHEVEHLGRRPLPVLRAERVDREPAHAHLHAALHGVPQRLFSGAVHIRDRLNFGRDKTGKVTAISVFEHGATVSRASVVAGQIAKVAGLGDVRIGDRR